MTQVVICLLIGLCLAYFNACVCLASLSRYSAPQIMGSRPWPFGVTWRHVTIWHAVCRVGR